MLQKLNDACHEAMKRIYVGESRIYVFGQGNPKAKLVLVGEAPGEQETLQGKPFVGKAGKNLDEFLEVLDVSREEIYITNAVKFRPVRVSERSGKPVNRPPSKEEIALFAPYLHKELDAVAPRIICTLGNVALRAVRSENEKESIGQVHGRWIEHKANCWLYPLYHPASVIYNRSLREVYLEDLKRLKEELEAHGFERGK